MKRILIAVVGIIYLICLGYGLYYWIYGQNGYFSRLEKEQVVTQLQLKLNQLRDELDKAYQQVLHYESNDPAYIEGDARAYGFTKPDEIIVKIDPRFQPNQSGSSQPNTIPMDSSETPSSFPNYAIIIFGGSLLTLLFLFFIRMLSHRNQKPSQ